MKLNTNLISRKRIFKTAKTIENEVTEIKSKNTGKINCNNTDNFKESKNKKYKHKIKKAEIKLIKFSII
jgi:hypothetical protein